MKKYFVFVGCILFSTMLCERPNPQVMPKPKPKPEQKPKDSGISAQEANCIMQVAGGFLQIMQDPNNATNVTNGIGGMVAGMANLFYELMKSKGLGANMFDEELMDLAQELAQEVQKKVTRAVLKRMQPLH